MDSMRARATEPEPKTPLTIASALVWAVLEWVLMLMLILDAVFGYLVVNFANYCGLHIPCLLCSKLKISSLVLCQIHNNLKLGVNTSGYNSVEPGNLGRKVEPEAVVERGSEELNGKRFERNNGVNRPSETVSLSEALPSPDFDGIQYEESKETDTTNALELDKNKLASASATTTVNVSMDPQETPMAAIANESSSTNETPTDPKPNITNTNNPQSLELGDAYTLATTGNRGRQLSGKFLEQEKSMAESRRASEDVKLLLSQLSAANSEDQIVQRRISLDRNESGLSLDGIMLSEVEGESLADRLKRQVEHDRGIISGLYRELEEERSASAVAASQAMAMITRLQEEKAALHMEALQCLRLMEEQAEYDGAALQRAKDLLDEKERWVRELEWELRPCEARPVDASGSNM